MKKISLLFLPLLVISGPVTAQQPVYKQASAPIEERVKDFLLKTTSREP